LPDFDFVQGISDVIDGTNAIAEKYPEFQTALTQRKLADIRELLEELRMKHNRTIAKRKYLQQLI